MIKKLFLEYQLPLERMIFKEAKRIGINPEEMNILFVLLQMSNRKRTFSLRAITKQVEYATKVVETNIQSLIDKNLITFELETTKEGRQREICNLDPIYQKIEEIINEDLLNEKNEKINSDIGELITIFETQIGRVLLDNELESIRRWFLIDKLEAKDIINLINEAKPPISIQKIERMRIRSLELDQKEQLDKKTKDALERLYKRV